MWIRGELPDTALLKKGNGRNQGSVDTGRRGGRQDSQHHKVAWPPVMQKGVLITTTNKGDDKPQPQYKKNAKDHAQKVGGGGWDRSGEVVLNKAPLKPDNSGKTKRTSKVCERVSQKEEGHTKTGGGGGGGSAQKSLGRKNRLCVKVSKRRKNGRQAKNRTDKKTNELTLQGGPSNIRGAAQGAQKGEWRGS